MMMIKKQQMTNTNVEKKEKKENTKNTIDDPKESETSRYTEVHSR